VAARDADRRRRGRPARRRRCLPLRDDARPVGISIETETFPYQDVHFVSEGGVDVKGGFSGKSKAAISALAKAKGAFTISFTSANAIAVVLRDLEIVRVKDEERLRREMMAAWRDSPRRLETDHVVVTKVIRAGSGAIAMSGEKGTKVGIAASTDIAPGQVDLAAVKGRLAIASTGSARFAIAANKGNPPLTPMFEMLHFAKNRQFWRFWDPVITPATRRRPPDLDDADDPGEVVGLDQVRQRRR